jgi:SAM-dependent methyltransferase
MLLKRITPLPLNQYIATFARGLVKRYGPSSIKRRLWDQEFNGEHWDFIDDTKGDCIYPYLQKYAKGGNILDLGCGPGNTANELDSPSYSSYVGVDISEAALIKALNRTVDNGRKEKNLFLREDFVNYTPTQKFDLILFRESLYHVPLRKLKEMLARYSNFLKPGGVFVVRIKTGRDGRTTHRPKATIEIIENNFNVLEMRQHSVPDELIGPTVIVFRPW